MQKFVLGIDCGTTLCKCVLFDLDGNVVAMEKSEYGMYQEQEGWAEQDPDWWWNAAVTNVRNVIKKTKIDSKSIVGIGADSQREAFVPLDAEGNKLWNSIIWLDKRTIPLAEEIKKILPADEVRDITGGRIDHVVSAPKIIWLKRYKPEIFGKTKKIVFSKDYIVFRLTNKAATDYSMASRTRLFNIRKKVWDEDICDALDIPISILPDVQGAWEVVGEVTKEISGITGLAEGTPVVSGGGDRPCESLGGGAINLGQMNIGSGTGTAFEVPLSEPHLDYKDRIDCCCNIFPDAWEYEVGLLTGACLRWFRDKFGYEEVEKAKLENGDPYHYLDELAEKVDEGSDMLFCYPYFMGAGAPQFDIQAKAVYFGFTLWHGKPHFVRSLLEGIAFQYIGIIELLGELGVRVKDASMTGGETKSRVWNQIKADVTGIDIRVPIVEDAAAALGSAILAGVGSGVYKNVQEGVKRCIRFKDVYSPRSEHHENYARIHEKYNKVYDSISKAYNIVTER
ncbi:MAG: FGGY family carbohydrate kinase [Nitrososphaeria archaeon]|jgi:xylulokinase